VSRRARAGTIRAAMTNARPPADRDALTVAMAVVPGFFSRNKMYALYKDPGVLRARARAALLRGVARQLAGANGETAWVSLSRACGEGCVLHYRVPKMHLERRVEMSELEGACVAYLVARAGASVLEATEHDRALIDRALARLAAGLEIGASPRWPPPVLEW